MDLPSEAVSKYFLFSVFIFNGTLPDVDKQYVYCTILFMNLIIICNFVNKTYFNRQSNDLLSQVELCVAQPSRSQVTGILKPFFV